MQYSQALVPLRSEVTGWQICLPGCYRLPDSPQSFHSQLAKKEKKKIRKRKRSHTYSAQIFRWGQRLCTFGCRRGQQDVAAFITSESCPNSIGKKAPQQNEDKGLHEAWHVLSSDGSAAWILQWGDEGQLFSNNLHLAAAKMKVSSALSL